MCIKKTGYVALMPPQINMERAFQQALLQLRAYIDKWELLPEGKIFQTHSSCLQAVSYKGLPAVLKVAVDIEEKRGALIMHWWDGNGAVKVLAIGDNALLMERATGKVSLAELSRAGHDDEASRIICKTARELHEYKRKQPLQLFIPLAEWFEDLRLESNKSEGIFSYALDMADELLSTPQDVRLLHGDLHHENILECNGRWLAIDPKGLVGERSFEFANIFCNPSAHLACFPGRLKRQVAIVAQESNVNRQRLIKWIIAYAGLSAAWLIQDKKNPEINFNIIEIAAAELNK